MIEQIPAAWMYKDTSQSEVEFNTMRLDHYYRPKYSSGEHDYVKGIALYTEEQLQAEVTRRLQILMKAQQLVNKAKSLVCTCFPHCDCDVEC